MLLVSAGAVHLDLHRTGCRNESSHLFGVNAFRVSPLLHRGALVISHHADPDDERAFRGLVEFGSIEELPAIFESVYAKHAAPTKRASPQAAHAGRREDGPREARIANFRRRFSPAKLFLDARVDELTIGPAGPAGCDGRRRFDDLAELLRAMNLSAAPNLAALRIAMNRTGTGTPTHGTR